MAWAMSPNARCKLQAKIIYPLQSYKYDLLEIELDVPHSKGRNP